MARQFRGVIASPVTPFTSDNELDLPTLQGLLEFHVRERSDGIAVPMHIGESLKLTVDERRRLVEAAVEAIDGRVPLLVHVSTAGTDAAVALTRHAEQAGADGVVVITPYHWHPSDRAQVEHFVAVTAASDLGVVGYNFPERLGVTVSADVLRGVIERSPNFVGLKDAGLDMEYFTEACRLTADIRPGFSVFSGVEYALPAMAVGAAGTFSACGGVAPRLVRSLFEACADGRYDDARPLQHRLSRLYQLIKPGYPASIKAAMEIMGRPCGGVRGPAEHVDATAMSGLEAGMAEMGILADEPHGW